jgi:hypothetical protein
MTECAAFGENMPNRREKKRVASFSATRFLKKAQV